MKITIIGGGTGTSSVLRGLKKHPELEISVIVTMMDDGGSNEVIREVFGLLPVSDIRKSLLALSETKDKKLKEIFEYRFSQGENLKGHTVGNLVLVALSKILESEEKSISEISKVLETRGKVIPVTNKMCKLVAEYTDGKIRRGEHNIDEPSDYLNEKILHIYTKPTVDPNPKALEAIEEADFIILGPGDLYTTTIANLLVSKVPETVRNAKGKTIYISNLMTKKGQTRHLTARGLCNEITMYAKRKPDFIILNNKEIPKSILKKYEKAGDHIVKDDLKDSDFKKIIRADIIDDSEVKKDKGDSLQRSLIRHDGEKIANVLKDIFDDTL